MIAERRFALTRIDTGDYMFVSNDGQRLWRVTSYAEEGDAWFGDGSTIKGVYWMASRFDGTLEQAEALLHRDVDEFLAWDRWELWENILSTRRAAIDSAMSAS